MPASSTLLDERITELAWSAWIEMGVSGWEQRPVRWAIDPEALLLLTAGLGDRDPRLRDEVTDWCVQYGRFLSRARLRNLLKLESMTVRECFGELVATVNAHSGLRWPGAAEPRAFQPSGKSRIDDFSAPALVVLRLRALLGVGARAEIIRVLLSNPGAALSAADLADAIAYTKRNTADALNGLGMAGLVSQIGVRNQLRFRLQNRDSLVALVGAVPEQWPRCDAMFRVLSRIRELTAEFDGLKPSVRAVRARKLINLVEADLQRAGLPAPQPEIVGADYTEAFEKWSLDLAVHFS